MASCTWLSKIARLSSEPLIASYFNEPSSRLIMSLALLFIFSPFFKHGVSHSICHLSYHFYIIFTFSYTPYTLSPIAKGQK